MLILIPNISYSLYTIRVKMYLSLNKVNKKIFVNNINV